jgi:phage tail tape-measure protein
MANRNISATIQIGATMSSSVGSVFGGIARKVNDLGASLSKLKRQSSDIARLQAAQGRMAEAQAKGNTAAVARYSAQIEKLSASLREAGVDTSRLTAEQARLVAQIRNVESSLSRAQRWSVAWNGLKSSAQGVGTAFGRVRDNVTSLATKLGVLGTAAGYLFKTQFVDTAAEFEKLQTVLKTLEGGDVNKAKQAFGWINDFAAKTPFDLKTVTEAFVRLRAYGIDPIRGDTLKSLGDTASAMGKPIMAAVEAIADAVTGENERLKEFGIKAAKEGGKIIYSYTDKAGKQRQKAVDANNREMIRSTLTAIWNEKYAGAMEEQSRTWSGMMSNIGDQWTRFTARVMASGLFDWMKGKLGGLLEEINRAAEDGRLQMWAEQTGAAIKDFFQNVWELGKSIGNVATATAGFVGGWKNLGVIMATIALAPTIASVVQLGVALKGLAVASWAVLGPWGLLAAAVIGAGAALIYYRQQIGEWLVQQPIIQQGLVILASAIQTITDAWTTVSNALDGVIVKMERVLGFKFNDIFRTGTVDPATSIVGREPDQITSSGARFFKKKPGFTTMSGETPVTPAGSMPAAAPQTNVRQNFQINVTAPSADPAAVGGAVRGAIQGAPLYDASGTHGPK